MEIVCVCLLGGYLLKNDLNVPNGIEISTNEVNKCKDTRTKKISFNI